MDEMLQIDLCNGQVRVMLCETTETVQRCADIHATFTIDKKDSWCRNSVNLKDLAKMVDGEVVLM